MVNHSLEGHHNMWSHSTVLHCEGGEDEEGEGREERGREEGGGRSTISLK